MGRGYPGQILKGAPDFPGVVERGDEINAFHGCFFADMDGALLRGWVGAGRNWRMDDRWCVVVGGYEGGSVQQPHLFSMGEDTQLFGRMTEVAFCGPGEYGRGGEPAFDGDLPDGFLRVDNQQVKGGFQSELDDVLFRGFSDLLFEYFLQMEGGVVSDARQGLQGDWAIKMMKDMVEDAIYSPFVLVVGKRAGHGCLVFVLNLLYFENMSQPGTIQFTIRRFSPEDLGLYKAIRLEALQLETGVFGSNYAREAGFTDEQWLARINGYDSDCFGLFHGDQLIGLTGIVIDWEDVTLAHMTQSYIRKEHRGKGLSRLLYEARLAWVSERPQIRRLRIGHRDSNHRSMAANQRYGFKFVWREPHDWPDGSREDILYYELVL